MSINEESASTVLSKPTKMKGLSIISPIVCDFASGLLINKPNILLLDEPTSAMDHSSEDNVKRRLIAAAAGKTIVLITHRSTMFDMVQRIIVVDTGRVVADGAKDAVIEALRTGKITKAL